MSQLDFVIAITLVITMISLVVFFSASSFSNKIDYIGSYNLENSVDSLASYLFEDVLSEKIKNIQFKLEETGNYSHQEEITLTLDGNFNNPHLYENSNEINIDVTGDDVSFTLNFDSAEKRYFELFYDGGVDDIIYSAANISSVILSEKDIFVVSLDKCSDIEYNNTKDMIGYDFKLEICNIGLDPPETGDVIVLDYPVLIFDDQGFNPTLTKIIMW